MVRGGGGGASVGDRCPRGWGGPSHVLEGTVIGGGGGGTAPPPPCPCPGCRVSATTTAVRWWDAEEGACEVLVLLLRRVIDVPLL